MTIKQAHELLDKIYQTDKVKYKKVAKLLKRKTLAIKYRVNVIHSYYTAYNQFTYKREHFIRDLKGETLKDCFKTKSRDGWKIECLSVEITELATNKVIYKGNDYEEFKRKLKEMII